MRMRSRNVPKRPGGQAAACGATNSRARNSYRTWMFDQSFVVGARDSVVSSTTLKPARRSWVARDLAIGARTRQPFSARDGARSIQVLPAPRSVVAGGPHCPAVLSGSGLSRADCAGRI